MFKRLDPLLNSELRLAVMSLLIGMEEAEFGFIREKTAATAGNLSVQLQKLKDAGYLEIKKSFRGKYPLTTCKVTPDGIRAFQEYVDAVQSYLEISKQNHEK